MASPYMTPARFAVSGFGIDTSSLSAVALRQTLVRASSTVDVWTGGPLINGGTSFRGGSIEGEEHTWRNPDPLVTNAGSRRIYPFRRPLRDVSAFSIKFTSTYQIDLNAATDLFLNTTENYVEVIASQPTIIGYPPLGYWYGLYEPVVSMDYTYGWQFGVTDDSLVAQGSGYWASYGNWLDEDFTVYKDGVAMNPVDYTLDTDSGLITPDTAAPSSIFTADYTYLVPDAIVQGTGLIATDMIAQSRIAARGLIGLQSLRVAEVAITTMNPSQAGYVTQNGVSIPSAAAALLMPFAQGSVGR